jgi:hypothetical protein
LGRGAGIFAIDAGGPYYALICAAEFFAESGDQLTGDFILDYADFLESRVERWTLRPRDR